MKRGYRLASARLGLALVLGVAWAMTAGGCGSLLGIDDGIPFPADGSVDSTVGADSAAGPDTTQGDDTSSVTETGSSGSDVSTNDSTAMDAPAMDAPGMDASGMDAPGMDSPAEAPGDDSGDACAAESNTAACGSNQCGTVNNNCSTPVACGVGGTPNCPSGQKCILNMGLNTCCVPATCGGRCNVMISDNCNGRLTCGSCTGANQVCDTRTSTCCVPDGTCGGPCVDNCGQNDPNCCDAGMMDAMPPPCTPLGTQCGGGQPPCCNNGICAPPPSPPPHLFPPGTTSGSSSGGPIIDSGGSSGGPIIDSGGSSGGPIIDSGPPPPPVCQP